ncbi:tetratricopeptide repeat protein [Leptothermofonsia sp. ETS-13]|uniref:tetratricopeptide repeat protein n=1 Tax=Leptothermofonsia sp. ETS-13 TaxID=3035696 RepID=UPI003B9DE073
MENQMNEPSDFQELVDQQFQYGHSNQNTQALLTADLRYLLAMQRYDQKQLPAAIALFQQCQSTYQQLKEPRSQADASYNLGMCHEALQQYKEAIGCYQMALALYQEIADSYWQTRALLALGKMYDHLGQTSQADQYYPKALSPIFQLFPKNQAMF